jgi:hypothetical protein
MYKAPPVGAELLELELGLGLINAWELLVINLVTGTRASNANPVATGAAVAATIIELSMRIAVIFSFFPWVGVNATV